MGREDNALSECEDSKKVSARSRVKELVPDGGGARLPEYGFPTFRVGIARMLVLEKRIDLTIWHEAC